LTAGRDKQSHGAVHRRPRASLLAASLLVSVALAGCGPAAPDPSRTFDGASLTIDARGLAFDPDIVTMPAGQPLRLVLNNHDEGVGHNLHVFQGDTEFGKSATVIGPGLAAVELPALPPGSYEFGCTIHPDMVGTLVVAVGATPGPTAADDSAPPDDTTPPDATPSPKATKTPRPTKTPRATGAPRATETPSAPSHAGG
jgi:plastocyanin